MPSRIEDYALIGDCLTAALVARDGSIDWLCLPRFDSGACFAALLGTPENGRWRIAPSGEFKTTRRRYREGTLVLETEFETESGAVRLIDFMPPRSEAPDVVRIVEGIRGQVPIRMELIIRFDYGWIVPWVRRKDGDLSAIAGPDMLRLVTSVEHRGENLTTLSDFTINEGQRVQFVLTWYPSFKAEPTKLDPEQALKDTETWWRAWSGRSKYDGKWKGLVDRSLITLKALTYAPTGGIVAAPTTSLPEQIGSVRNWDYRYCWVRDATFTLDALLAAGYVDEARAWREWLLRAVAGKPSVLQIMYGLEGERRLTEYVVDWLPGYEESAPVRIGNAAHNQFQLDVYGELLDAMHQSRRAGVEAEEAAWRVETALMGFLESHWDKPDEGIWEVRGPRRHFTHSKVMAWVAVDRAVRAIEEFYLAGPVDRWKALRDTIHSEVCEKGYNARLGSFVQFYGGETLDASLLMIPLVGFLPPDDRRVRGTVEAIEKGLTVDGFVARYPTKESIDGLPPGEGMFLACTFWLVDNLKLLGRERDAEKLFERLLGLCNDVGLLSEEYDPHARRLVGNFPQAFSHISLINAAYCLSQPAGQGMPRRHR